jgi:hypothetical protein
MLADLLEVAISGESVSGSRGACSRVEAEGDAIVPVPGFPAAGHHAPGTLRPGSWAGVTAPLAGLAAAVFLAWRAGRRDVHVRHRGFTTSPRESSRSSPL